MTDRFSPITVSAPGSIMLFGEHAVLHGTPAVVAAIDERVRVTLTPCSDASVNISSKLFETIETDISHLNVIESIHKARFVHAAIQLFKDQIPSGFHLEIVSAFSDQMGLGSSAAVTVAVVGAFQQWLVGHLDLYAIFKKSRAVIHAVQGIGSCSDVAASTFGGILCYQPDPFSVEKIVANPSLHLIYSGYKTPTVEVVRQVEARVKEEPEFMRRLFQRIGAYTVLGAKYLQQADWKRLGRVFTKHQQLQKKMGVSDTTLDALIANAMAQPGVFGAKISGAGLGDCIVVLGDLKESAVPSICVIPSKEGIQVQKI
ncbi:MAG: mevalonate kinase [Gammaproteobacteria bacterium]|nr:mevalonate kinase [Gammaproteobacteria bacterium]